MAKLSRGKSIVRDLTPEMVNRAIAESVLVNAGIDLDGKCEVIVNYVFTKGNKNFQRAIVKVVRAK